MRRHFRKAWQDLSLLQKILTVLWSSSLLCWKILASWLITWRIYTFHLFSFRSVFLHDIEIDGPSPRDSVVKTNKLGSLYISLFDSSRCVQNSCSAFNIFSAQVILVLQLTLAPENTCTVRHCTSPTCCNYLMFSDICKTFVPANVGLDAAILQLLQCIHSVCIPIFQSHVIDMF